MDQILKPLLSRALQDDLPVQVLRGAKRTFTFPFETWLRQGLGEQVERETGSSLCPWRMVSTGWRQTNLAGV